MPWSFDSATGTLRQTGTETSLAGLSSVPANCTTTVRGTGASAKTIYTLQNIGSGGLTYENLTIDPLKEELVFPRNTSNFSQLLMRPASANSVLQIGYPNTSYGTNECAIHFLSDTGNAYEVRYGFDPFQGTLNWYYGTIRVNGACTGMGGQSFNSTNSALRGYIGPYATLEVVTPPSGQPTESCQLEVATHPSFVFDGPTLRGFGTTPPSLLLSFCSNTVYTTTPRFRLEGTGGVTYQAGDSSVAPITTTSAPVTRQTWANRLTVRALSFVGGTKGLNIWLGSILHARNLPAGSATPITCHNMTVAHSQGYVQICQEATFTFVNEAGGTFSNVATIMRDTNNGARKVYNLCGQNIDNTADRVYVGSTSNGSMSFAGETGSQQEILTCAVAHLVANSDFADNVGQNLKDLRSRTNVPGADDFRFYHWSYAGQLVVSDCVLKSDAVPFQKLEKVVADTNVSLSESAAVARLATNFTVNTGTNTITVNAASTYDDLYDCMKAWKTRPVQAQLEYPSMSTQPVIANGDAVETTMTISGLSLLSPGNKFKRIYSVGSTDTTGLTYDAGTNTLTIASTYTGTTVQDARYGLFKLRNQTLPTPSSVTTRYTTSYVDFGNVNIVLGKNLNGALLTTGTFTSQNSAACSGRVIAANSPESGDWIIDATKKELRYGASLATAGVGTIAVNSSGMVTGTGTAFTSALVGQYLQIATAADRRVFLVSAHSSATGITLRRSDNGTYDGGTIAAGTAYRTGAAGGTTVDIGTLAMCPAVNVLRIGDAVRADIEMSTDWRVYVPDAYNVSWDIRANTALKYNLVSLRVPGSLNGGAFSTSVNNSFAANLHIAGPLLLNGTATGGTDGVTALSEYVFFRSTLTPAPSNNFGEYYSLWLGNVAHAINGGRMDIGGSLYINGSAASLVNGLRWMQPNVSFNAVVFATTGDLSNCAGFSRLHSWVRVPSRSSANALTSEALTHRLDTANVVFDEPILRSIAGKDVRMTGLVAAKFRNPDTSKLDVELAQVYNTSNTANMGGVFEVTQTFSGSVRDAAGQGLSGTFWVPDTYNSGKRRRMTTGSSGKDFIPDAPNEYPVVAGAVAGEFLLAAYALNRPPFAGAPSTAGTVSISPDGLVSCTAATFTHGDYVREMIFVAASKRYAITERVSDTEIRIANTDMSPYADGQRTGITYSVSPQTDVEMKDSRGPVVRAGWFFSYTHRIVYTDIRTETRANAAIEVKSEVDTELSGRAQSYIESLEYLPGAAEVMGAHKIWRVNNRKTEPVFTRVGDTIYSSMPVRVDKTATSLFAVDYDLNLAIIRADVLDANIVATDADGDGLPVTEANGAVIGGYVLSADGVRVKFEGLDPEGFDGGVSIGLIRESDYNSRDTTKPPAQWVGFNQINVPAGNVAYATLAGNTSYKLFHRGRGYAGDEGPIQTFNTALTQLVSIRPIVDVDSVGPLWPRCLDRTIAAQAFAYNPATYRVDVTAPGAEVFRPDFLTLYRAFEGIAKSPALVFQFTHPLRLNFAGDGFVFPAGNPLAAAMSEASTQDCVMLADFAEADGSVSFFRLRPNSAGKTLAYTPATRVSVDATDLTIPTVPQIVDGVEASTVLAKKSDLQVVNDNLRATALGVPHDNDLGVAP